MSTLGPLHFCDVFVPLSYGTFIEPTMQACSSNESDDPQQPGSSRKTNKRLPVKRLRTSANTVDLSWLDDFDHSVAEHEDKRNPESPINSVESQAICPEPTLLLANLTLGPHSELICVKVEDKSDLKRRILHGQEKKVFSANIADSSGDARLACFQKNCDKYYDLLQPNETYEILRFDCRLTDPRFKTTISNFEIILTDNSVIRHRPNVTLRIPEITYNSIKWVKDQSAHTVVHVCGILLAVGKPISFTRKRDGTPGTRSEAWILDEEGTSLPLTIWNGATLPSLHDDHPVVFLTHAKTSVYKGTFALAVGDTARLNYNLDHPRTAELRNWWSTQNVAGLLKNLRTTNTSNAPSMSFEAVAKQLRDPAQERQSNPVIFCNEITLLLVHSDNLMYKSCSNIECKKKLQPLPDGQWHCSKCNQIGPKFQWRFMLRLIVKDAATEIRCTAFDEVSFNFLSSSLPGRSLLRKKLSICFPGGGNDLGPHRRKFRCDHQR